MSSVFSLSAGFTGVEGSQIYEGFSKFNAQTGAAALASTLSKVPELVKIGRVVGPAGFYIGEVADLVGLYNGYITPDHALGNFAAGLAGFVPALAPFSVTYFVVDGFYKGGVGGIVHSVSSYQYEQAHANDPPPSYQNIGIEDVPGWNR
jgi:hypothetical protein